MTASPRCVLSTTSAVGALTTMVEHRFRHLPVLEAEEAGDGSGALRCVGLLDIAKCLYDAISAIDAAVTGGGAPTLGSLLEAVKSEHGDAPAVVAAAATVQEAAAAMVARRSAVLVEVAGVDGKTKSVAGIVTPKDLLNRVVARSLPAGATRVDAVMTPNPDTMPSSATVLQALHQLQYGGYRNLPVVSDADGRPLGVADVLSLMRGLTAGRPRRRRRAAGGRRRDAAAPRAGDGRVRRRRRRRRSRRPAASVAACADGPLGRRARREVVRPPSEAEESVRGERECAWRVGVACGC